MEDFLLVVLLVAFLWLAFKQARLEEGLGKIDELGGLVRRLEQRIAALERAPEVKSSPVADTQVVAAPTAAPPPVVRPTVQGYQDLRAHQNALRDRTPVPAPEIVAEFPSPAEPVVRAEPVTPPPPPFVAPAPARSVSLEERLGQNWLNKLGIVSLVVGVALFLGYQLEHLGPPGKSLIGLAVSLLLLGGGLILERREQYRLFARAGIGGGWGLLFFVSFALYHVDAMRILDSQLADLILMLLVAGAMVWHSLAYKSEVVTSLAFLLAFLTVGMSNVTLFSLVAGTVLAAALVLVAARERWFALGLAGLAGVYFNHFLWLSRVLPDGGQPGHPFPDFFASATLLVLYWFIFRLFFILRVPLDRRQEMLSSLTAILNSAGLLLLLKYQSAYPQWAFYALLALGLAEWAFAFAGRSRWRGSFIVLSSIASILLLAAIPFRFSGASWTLLWLLEAEILFLAGIRMPEIVFRRLGTIGGFVAALQIFLFDALPAIHLFDLPGIANRDTPAMIALFSAAAIFWCNGEFVPLRWPSLFQEEFDSGALQLFSYVAPVLLTIALWILVPGSWTVVVWLAAALTMGFVADRIASTNLATQADLLALASLLRIMPINFGEDGHLGGVSLRAITVGLAAALLYGGMVRKTRGHVLPSKYIPAAYSWAACCLLAILAWDEFPALRIAGAWGVLGLILFEAGIWFRRISLRLQAYTLFGASFLRIFLVNLGLDAGWHAGVHRFYTVLPLIAAYLWVYERTRRALRESRLDLGAGLAAAWIGAAATVALLYVEVPPNFVAIAWAGFAMLLVYAAWILKRSLFAAQSLAVLALATFRLLEFHLFAEPTLFPARWILVVTACGLMLLSLPAAFAIRRIRLAEGQSDGEFEFMLTHPEQPFFFVPLVLGAISMAIELRGGNITIGWIALGLAAFLFALPLGERSYRLAGLGLLLLGLAKILLVDFWSASPADKYLTLIVTGVALLLVSFLYSRYKQTILKFL